MAYKMVVELELSDEDVADLKEAWNLSDEEFEAGMQQLSDFIKQQPTVLLDQLDWFND